MGKNGDKLTQNNAVVKSTVTYIHADIAWSSMMMLSDSDWSSHVNFDLPLG